MPQTNLPCDNGYIDVVKFIALAKKIYFCNGKLAGLGEILSSKIFLLYSIIILV